MNNLNSPIGKLTVLLFTALLLIAAANSSVSAQTDAARKIKLVDQINDDLKNLVNAKLIEKFVNFNLSPQCWDKLTSHDSAPDGVDHVNRIGYSISQYAKLMGYGDTTDFEAGTIVKWERVDPIISKLQGNFSYTIEAKNVACNDESWRLLAAYSQQIHSFFGDSSLNTGMNRGWRPRAGKMFVTLVLDPKAKDISVKISTDGSQFAVTAPSEVEPSAWDDKISNGLEKAALTK